MTLVTQIKRVSVIFLSLLALVNCSMKDNLDDMHNKTDNMSDTTDHLAKTSDGMASTTNDLKAVAQSTYYGLRTVQTAQLRKESFDGLVAAEDMPSKLASATMFYYAMEFQSWTDQDLDDAKKLENLKDLAMEEFFERIQKFYAPDHMWQVILPPHALDFDAMAAVMHRILPDQLDLAHKKNFPPMSVYSIISDGLLELKRNPARKPETMPKWMYAVQIFHKIAVDLLKTRVSYLPFQLYAELSELNANGSIRNWFTSGSDAREWNIDYLDSSLAEIAKHNEYLEYALQSRKLLYDLGFYAGLDDSDTKSLKIKTIYEHMNIADNLRSNTPEYSEKIKEINRFRYLSSLLLKSTQDFGRVDSASYSPPAP